MKTTTSQARSGRAVVSPLAIDWSSETAIASAVQGIYETQAAQKHILEREWYQNIAWYLGLQNLVWGRTSQSLYEPEAPAYRVRLVVNHLQSTIRTLASKLHKNAPEWDVIPATTDASDLQVAQISAQLLQANWYRMAMDEKSIELILWMLVTGNVFAKMYWDPDSGPPIFTPGIEGVEIDEDDLMIGESLCKIVSPFSMIVDPSNSVFRDADWCIETNEVDLDELKEQYPRASQLKPDTLSNSSRIFPFLDHLKTLASRGGMVRSSNEVDKNAVLVHELWVKPRNKAKGALKKGKLVVVAGGQVLNGSGLGVDFPYHHGELPYSHFGEVLVPGRVWYDCTLTQLKHLQMDYNRTKSQLIEARNLTSKPKWTCPKGSGIAKGSITSEPGEIIHHNPGFKPEKLDPPNVPAYVQNMLASHKEDMEDLSGVHEVSRAQAPGQVRGSRGVLALIEQDESRLSLVIKHVEQQTSRLGRQNLALEAQFATEKRLARVIGTNDELLMFAYSGNSLIGRQSMLPGANYFDVRVRTVSGFPQSRAAQLELLSTLLQNGVLNPEANPKDKRLVLQTLSIGTIQDHLDKARVHRSRQLQEIDGILQGQPISAEWWHDHDVHLEVLNEFRNSAQYDLLEDQDRALLEEHAQAHKQWLAYLAVEPELLTRQAAMAGMVHMKMGQTANAAQNESAAMLQGAGNERQNGQNRLRSA
jgi:hypothetical protein